MTDRPPASAAPPPPGFWKRLSPRALMATLTLAFSAFMWPGLLQIEHLPGRAETLKVLGPAIAGEGGDLAPAAAPRARLRVRGSIPHLNVPAAPPYYGALREGRPLALSRDAVDTTPAVLTLDDLANAPGVTTQQTSADPGSTPFAPPTAQPNPGGFFGGPGTPSTGNPVTNPPVTNPPVTNPPVTNPPDPTPPVVNPPVVDPNPPVVTPVNPPVVTPPLVVDPSPPVIEPFDPGRPVDPGNPVHPGDPGDPGGGGGGGDHHPPGVPEPSVWMELILGAGLAGASLRRARLQPAAIALRAASRA